MRCFGHGLSYPRPTLRSLCAIALKLTPSLTPTLTPSLFSPLAPQEPRYEEAFPQLAGQKEGGASDSSRPSDKEVPARDEGRRESKVRGMRVEGAGDRASVGRRA